MEHNGRVTGPIVELRDVAKRFRRADGVTVNAIDGVSLELRAGELLVLLGPSGCGKTTLLRSIAGLERPDRGRIRIRGDAVFDPEAGVLVPPERRAVSMIFQSYALWPHMTVFENVAYPLRNRPGRKPRRRGVAPKVEAVLELLGLAGLARQHPGQLSGGQQQRVALARALIAGDDLILFDEPLSNVDAKVREQLRLELVSMQAELGFSAIYVTHDQAEALELAHRIAVMDSGRVSQISTPREIYERPASRSVAHFIGTSNELIGTVRSLAADGTAVVDTALGEVSGSPGVNGLAVGEQVAVVYRPERCLLSESGSTAAVNRFRGEVVTSRFLGPHVEVVVNVGDQQVRVWSPRSQVLERGAVVWVSVEPSDMQVLALDPAKEEGDESSTADLAGARGLDTAHGELRLRG
jgi:iron(III) transport system ATP-binding protein